MKKRLWLACLLGLTGCARKTPPPSMTPLPRASPTPTAPKLEQPRSLPLRLSPPPPRPARDFRLPELRLTRPQVTFPDYRLDTGKSLWPNSSPRQDLRWDPRFDRWHMPDLTRTGRPRPLPGPEFDLDAFVQPPKADVFRTMKWDIDRSSSLRGALDDYERQQRELREKYVPFPIPVTLPIPF